MRMHACPGPTMAADASHGSSRAQCDGLPPVSDLKHHGKPARQTCKEVHTTAALTGMLQNADGLWRLLVHDKLPEGHTPGAWLHCVQTTLMETNLSEKLRKANNEQRLQMVQQVPSFKAGVFCSPAQLMAATVEDPHLTCHVCLPLWPRPCRARLMPVVCRDAPRVNRCKPVS